MYLISLSREVLVKDGAALVNILASDNIKPFYEYESKVFRPYMLSKLRHHNRVDIVWDEYIARQLEDRDPKKREEHSSADKLSHMLPYKTSRFFAC